MGWCLRQRQYRREAHIAAREQVAPLVARFFLESRAENLFQLRPARSIMLRWQTRLVEIQAFEQPPVEAAFDCPDRNVFPVRSLINAVPGGAAVEGIDAACVLPQPGRHAAVEDGHEASRTVAHCGVDHLAFARRMPFDQRAGYPEGEIHGPAAIVPDEIERRERRLPCASNRV